MFKLKPLFVMRQATRTAPIGNLRRLFCTKSHQLTTKFSKKRHVIISTLSICVLTSLVYYNFDRLNIYGNLISNENVINSKVNCDQTKGESDDNNNHYLSLKELKFELNKRLSIIRQQLTKQGKPTPQLFILSNDTVNEYEIRFELDKNINISQLLKCWFQILLNSSATSKSTTTSSSFSNSKNNVKKGTKSTPSPAQYPPTYKFQNDTMTAISYDRNAKLIWYTDSDGHIVSLRKVPGFTAGDVDTITKGYEDVLLSYFVTDDTIDNNDNNDSSGYYQHQADIDTKGDAADLMRRLFKGFLQQSPDSSTGTPFSIYIDNNQQDEDSDSDSKHSFNSKSFIPPHGQQGQRQGGKGGNHVIKDPLDKLESLGVQVIRNKSYKNDHNTNNSNSKTDSNDTTSGSSCSSELTWDHLAGYEDIKRQIEDTVINSFLHADIYDAVARKTRLDFESNRPTALLLTGPPGVGKTLTARILSNKVDRPLIVLKLENILSKWYGESEKKLSEIFDICENELSDDGVVIFIDEIDALAGNRENDMHEASRRLLSVILQRVEGFQGKCKSLIICATNRHQDLDSALISRFDLIIKYNMPDFNTRKAIIQRYAKQFSQKEDSLNQLAEHSSNLSCRDIKECCEDVERKWASKIVKKEIKNNDLIPPLKEYLENFKSRATSMNSRVANEYGEI